MADAVVIGPTVKFSFFYCSSQGGKITALTGGKKLWENNY